jgi:hypothetical protein
MTPHEANRVRWSGEPGPFYEVWYVIAVEPRSGDGLWIRYTLLNPTDAHPAAGATAWFAWTCRREPERSFAITRHFAPGSFVAAPGTGGLVLGEPESPSGSASEPAAAQPCLWDDAGFSGAIASGEHRVRWELRFGESSAQEAHLLMPPSLRRFTDRRAILTIPRPRLSLEGTVEIDGRAIEIAAAPGHQAHHYGRERAAGWDWAHCAHFEEDPSAVVEALAPQLGGGRVQPSFLHLHTAERVYRCEGAADLLRNRAAAGLGWWRFTGHEGGVRVVAEFSAATELVLPFTYHSTAYVESRCWNAQIADCLVRVFEGDRPTRVLRCRGKAAAEMHRTALAELPYEAWHTRVAGDVA